MKYYISVLCLFVVSLNFAQEEADSSKHLLDTDWGKEIFPLPTGFAQEMTLSGFEDASFAPGWSDLNSDEFWTYVFAWSVEGDGFVKEDEIVSNLELYFNGLVGAKPDTLVNGRLPTSVLLMDTSKQNSNSYIGKVRLFDRFKTNKMLTLNLIIEQQYCSEQKRALLVFRFSPKHLKHEVWERVNAVKLFKNACNKK